MCDLNPRHVFGGACRLLPSRSRGPRLPSPYFACTLPRGNSAIKAAEVAATSGGVGPVKAFKALNNPDELLDLLGAVPLNELMLTAASLRDQAHAAVTFSPKVFIPLTRLCRDTCGYCTFAQGPTPGRRVYMKLDEVLAVARLGAEYGCTEALFTLGAALALI